MPQNHKEIAVFAAGCFWGVEHAFRALPGVVKAISGYTGGHVPNPSYDQVCTGNTGHAEAVELHFDPAIIPYAALLKHFWAMHDPTTPNRQGVDVGSQYRSAIFYHTASQRAEAEQSLKHEQKSWPAPIVTEILPASSFWPAEEYHQEFFEKHPSRAAFCHTHYWLERQR